MRIALTGATGFIGRYIAAELVQAGHRLRCWHRSTSDRGGFEQLAGSLEWVEGDLGSAASGRALVEDTDAVVHAALYHPRGGFRGGEGDLEQFVTSNIVGTIRLIEAARAAGVGRFVFISTCAVTRRSSTIDRSMKPIRSGRPATTAPTRPPSRSTFIATVGATAIRSARCGRPVSMAWPTRWKRAAGSSSYPPWSAASR